MSSSLCAWPSKKPACRLYRLLQTVPSALVILRAVVPSQLARRFATGPVVQPRHRGLAIMADKKTLVLFDVDGTLTEPRKVGSLCISLSLRAGVGCRAPLTGGRRTCRK